MADTLTIQSHRGPYSVVEVASVAALAAELGAYERPWSLLIDARVAVLHADALAPVLARSHVVLIEATEHNKALAQMEAHVDALMARGAKRDHLLVAIGGGILQDITCFLASTLFRGMDWELVPTTLLAQADSCIGSKSSINVGRYKNLMGTFVPPRRILLCAEFLRTLDEVEVRSGIGEILKVHLLAGPAAFDALAQQDLLADPAALRAATWAALRIKQHYIELDEFDRGPRNVMNYGHSFGHALESATGFGVPHGIAVTIGMDLANEVACWRGGLGVDRRDAIRASLRRYSAPYLGTAVPQDEFFAALGRDKKNEGTRFAFILLDRDGVASKVFVDDSSALRELCGAFFAGLARGATA